MNFLYSRVQLVGFCSKLRCVSIGAAFRAEPMIINPLSLPVPGYVGNARLIYHQTWGSHTSWKLQICSGVEESSANRYKIIAENSQNF